jgi:hypothetical protein
MKARGGDSRSLLGEERMGQGNGHDELGTMMIKESIWRRMSKSSLHFKEK